MPEQIEAFCAADQFFEKFAVFWPDARKDRQSAKKRVEGKWALSGYETGKGWAFGQMTVRRDREEDAFVTDVEFRY